MKPEHGQDGGTGRLEEAALSAALRDAADDLMPDTAQLVRGGVARGKRMRVARRAQVVVAAVAVVALGGTGAVALGDLGGGGKSVAAPGASVAGTASPSAAPTPPTPARLTEQQVSDALRQLLPAGAQVEDAGMPPSSLSPAESTAWPNSTKGANSETDVYLRVDADGQGFGLVTLLISSGNTASVCPDQPDTAATCTLVPQADGSQLRLEKNWEYPASATTADGKPGPNGAGAQLWSAVLERTDGVRIYVSASSAMAEKGADTRESTALTLEQLQGIATAPVWAGLVTPDSLPQPSKGDRPRVSVPPAS